MKPDQLNPDIDAMRAPESSAIHSPSETGQWNLPSGAIPTEFLFRGNQEILISHKGEDYRLRITRNGKLILTK